ncbi:uracil-DNA glycosylase [Litchfieldia salsa]|uniref:Uracil-DNA glycosylase n=1 Tax=Litchfieldia salsa TaxID=930152 RepID=A0A1H0U717_9BACI|nr:uracil-DNA glycosylase [Litchfieldia salsa]SDP62092.1 Uracil-DNA glycosylase [Litchfieldia salsa]
MNMIDNQWARVLEHELHQDYFLRLSQYLKCECDTFNIYPEMNEIFNSFQLTDFHEVKVVILGQDPYHGPGQAHGLSFSVKPEVKIPPSLLNIFKELQDDLGHSIPNNGCLEKWAKQGVLLLNTVLTVRQGEPNSHKGQGWELLTDAIIKQLNDREKPVIFILWGKHAISKSKLITNLQHFILTAPHPSPLSVYRGFFGSKPFSKVNEILRKQGLEEIDWQIEDI